MPTRPELPFANGYEDLSIGEGWFTLVNNLHKELLRIDPEYKVLQVKEKFGSLRFYCDMSEHCSDKETFLSLVDKYEKLSAITCEICGLKGEIVQDRGWYICLCPDEIRKRNILR